MSHRPDPTASTPSPYRINLPAWLRGLRLQHNVGCEVFGVGAVESFIGSFHDRCAELFHDAFANSLSLSLPALGITAANFKNLAKFIWICGMFNLVPFLFIQLVRNQSLE